MQINSSTQLFCILGKPVRHSLSPVIHNTAFTKSGINAVYLAFEPDTIEGGISSIRSLNIKGASITIPFKVEAIKYLDKIDPLAEKIGSINTIQNYDGELIGYNTDGYGAVKALENNRIEIKNSRVMVIGNGGSARAIAFTLLEQDANVIIAGRNPEKIKNLTSDLRNSYNNVECIQLTEINNDYMSGVDTIINTTPLGMAPDVNLVPIDPGLLQEKHVVFDIVYSPDITRLLDSAISRGCRIVRGIEMLINQGIKQFEIWTGMNAPLKEITEAVNQKLTLKK